MKKPCFSLLSGGKKNMAQLADHLRLLRGLPQFGGVYHKADTVGQIVKLYKMYRRKAKAKSGDALFNFVLSKFDEVFDAAQKISAKGVCDGRLERVAFEICRHTRLAADISETAELCREVCGMSLEETDGLADCLELKRCQMFCLAAYMALQGEKQAEELLANIFCESFTATPTRDFCCSTLQSDGLAAKVYSEGNFALSLDGDDITCRDDKFLRSDGVRFCFFENGRQLGESFVSTAFSDKMAVCKKRMSSVDINKTVFLKEGRVVVGLEIINRSPKARNIELLCLADLNSAACDELSFAENTASVSRCGDFWFCFSCDRQYVLTENRNCGITEYRVSVPLKVAAKSITKLSMSFGVYREAKRAAAFAAGAKNFDFYKKNFVICKTADVKRLGENPPNVNGGAEFNQKLKICKKAYLGQNSLTPVCGYNVDSFFADNGEIFSVGDGLITTPKFGGDRIYARIDGKIYLLNGAAPIISGDVAVFSLATAAVDIKLEVSHFGEKQYKISCINKSGKNKTLSVALCLDFFKKNQVRRAGERLDFCGVSLWCSQPYEVATSALAFDKFNPDFCFADDLSGKDLCAVKSKITVEKEAAIVFRLKKKTDETALKSAYICGFDFWQNQANTLSTTLMHAELKEIGLFSLPVAAYTDGSFLFDILRRLYDDGLCCNVITCKGNERSVSVSPWAFALGAAWFVSLYGGQVECGFLLKRLEEILTLPSYTAEETIAKAVCLKKTFAFADNKAAHLTAMQTLADEASLMSGDDLLLAQAAGIVRRDWGGSPDEIYAMLCKRLVPKADCGFLQVAVLENFVGIQPQNGLVKLCPDCAVQQDKRADCRIFGKKMVLKFHGSGSRKTTLNGKEFPGALKASGLGDVSFIDVYY